MVAQDTFIKVLLALLGIVLIGIVGMIICIKIKQVKLINNKKLVSENLLE